MNIKAISSFVKDVKQFAKDEYYNTSADYPEDNSRKALNSLREIESIELPDGELSNAKDTLISSLTKVSELSKNHYVFHDNLSRREDELRDCKEDEKDNCQQNTTNSKEDFDKNQSELSDWVQNL
jgi:penicillin V acylase-like amidase (Ntn superfamily)